MKRLFLFILASVFLQPFPMAFASETDGTIDPDSVGNKYAWSENIGWINFGVASGNIHITDAGITGYAWSEQKGWINMAPSQSGVTVDGAGNLSGFAWGEGTGYIDFSNVSISATGQFEGSATSSITGTITFDCTNCSVETDYLPADFRTSSAGGRRRHADVSGEEDEPSEAGFIHGSADADVNGGQADQRKEVERKVCDETSFDEDLLYMRELLADFGELLEWRNPVDYELLKHSSGIKRAIEMKLLKKKTFKRFGSLSCYAIPFDLERPDEKDIQLVAELAKMTTLSFPFCFEEKDIRLARRADRGDLWWRRYVMISNPLLRSYIGESFLAWDKVPSLSVLRIWDDVLNDLCDSES